MEMQKSSAGFCPPLLEIYHIILFSQTKGQYLGMQATYLNQRLVIRRFCVFCIVRTRCSRIPKKLESAITPQFENILNSVMRFVLEQVNELQNLFTMMSRTEIFRCTAEVTKNCAPNLRSQLQQQSLRSWLSTKVYYVPLYFSIYFTIYIGYLILKAISIHKIQIPLTTASSFLLFARNFHSISKISDF